LGTPPNVAFGITFTSFVAALNCAAVKPIALRETFWNSSSV
jgi:hypothetical protein